MSVGLTSESKGQNSDWAPYPSTQGHGPSNTGMQLPPEVEELMLVWPASLRCLSWLYYRALKESLARCEHTCRACFQSPNADFA